MAMLRTPTCRYMSEIPTAEVERSRLSVICGGLGDREQNVVFDPLSTHILHGLACTVGSALGSTPPSEEQCLEAFTKPNQVGLTAGARAWSKHSHRSEGEIQGGKEERRQKSDGWWGTPCGPIAMINARALELFWRVSQGATWRNLHWLPHQVLVYEIRVEEGYGMRWSQDRSTVERDESMEKPPWLFRGCVEPMMENGHDVGWKHSS